LNERPAEPLAHIQNVIDRMPLGLAVEQRAISSPRGTGQGHHGTRICQPGGHAPRLLLISHAAQ
jgi:hypothetical protein